MAVPSAGQAGRAPGPWSGCHGIRVTGEGAARLGLCSGEPLAELALTAGAPAEPGKTELWSQGLPAGEVQRMSIGDHGDVVLELGPGRRVSLSASRDVVTVGDPTDWAEVQLVASFMLPFLVEGDRTLVLHAAALSRGGEAILITGPGGTGKSSSLVGLMESGWAPLSEDVCVVDLSGPEPLAWPGPPWVRRRHGEPGPAGAPVLFESSEKTAWDLGPFRDAPPPVPVAGIVILERAGHGATAADRVALPAGPAIAALAPHAVWLWDLDETARRLFGPVAEAAARIPVSALRLPVRDDWVDLLAAAL